MSVAEMNVSLERKNLVGYLVCEKKRSEDSDGRRNGWGSNMKILLN